MKAKCTATLLLLLLTAGVVAAEPETVVGDYVEARSALVFTCGCFFSGESVTAGREAILAWRIREGTWGGVPLNNLSVVAVLGGAENLIHRDTPRKSALYLDASANKKERDALLALFTHHFAHLLGDVVSVQVAPIVWHVGGEAHDVMIEGKIEVSIRKSQPEDAHPGAQLWDEPFISLTDAMLATMQAYTYQDTVLNVRWQNFEPRITGYFGTFTLPARSSSRALIERG